MATVYDPGGTESRWELRFFRAQEKHTINSAMSCGSHGLVPVQRGRRTAEECEYQEAGIPGVSTVYCLPFLHCSLNTECLYPLNLPALLLLILETDSRVIFQ